VARDLLRCGRMGLVHEGGDRPGRRRNARLLLRFAPVLLAVAWAAACGGSVGNDAAVDGGGGVGGTLLPTGGTGGTVHTGGTGGKDAGKDAKQDAEPPDGWVDPPCPDAPPPPPIKDCDPFGPNTCGSGMACYPYVQYPSQPCDVEQFGAICAPEGTGTQGDNCYSQNCAGGFVCVITGQGTECVELCQLGTKSCPKGLFCVPIDVEGYGGCY
jgi:hypothetical protein